MSQFTFPSPTAPSIRRPQNARLSPPPSTQRPQQRQGTHSASSSRRSSGMLHGTSSFSNESSSQSRHSSPTWQSREDENLRLRRKISALEDTVNRLVESTGGSSKRSKTCSPYLPGRGIRKIVDLYHDLTQLLFKAGKHAATNTLDATELAEIDKIDFVGLSEDDIEEERKDRKRCHTAVQILNRLIPGFQDKVKATDDLPSLLSPLQTGANDARSDDTGKLKIVVAEWLNSRMSLEQHHNSNSNGDESDSNDNGNSHIPILSSKGKDERGISNNTTGRLICPIDYDWDDPIVRTKLRDGEPNFDMTSSFFLRCLYENETGDPESSEEGFLKGPLLVRAFRQIFTSPSSACKENEASDVTSRRRDVANTLQLNGQVTPRAIAYTATQLVFSLNTSRDWKQEHAGFHYPSFYNFIVDYFEDIEDDISREANDKLLRWWNRKIFPPATHKNGTSIARGTSASSQKRVQESRARRARMAQDSQQTQPGDSGEFRQTPTVGSDHESGWGENSD